MIKKIKEDIINASNSWVDNSSLLVAEYRTRNITKYKEGNIVLLGMRRLGKTEYLKYRFDLMNTNSVLETTELQANTNDEPTRQMHTLFVDFDAPMFITIDFKADKEKVEAFTRAIYELLVEKDIKLILFDEIQRLKGWGRWLKGLIDTFTTKTFVATGSDVVELHSGTEYGGDRFKILYMGPVSFKEFKAVNMAGTTYLDHINYGIYPGPKRELNSEFALTVEKQFKTTGIAEKNLGAVLKVIALNPGTSLTSGSLAKTLKESGESKIDTKQAKVILEFLEQSKMIFKLKELRLSSKVTKTDKYRYYLSNWNTYMFFTSFTKYQDIVKGSVPRSGFVFENYVISNVYSTLDNDLKQSKIYYESDQVKNIDLDLVINEKRYEIKAYDVDITQVEIIARLKVKQQIFNDMIIIHTGETKELDGLPFINVEEFLEGELWV